MNNASAEALSEALAKGKVTAWPWRYYIITEKDTGRFGGTIQVDCDEDLAEAVCELSKSSSIRRVEREEFELYANQDPEYDPYDYGCGYEIDEI